MNKIKIHRFNKPIKITQATLPYGLQSWLETILLIADPELKRLNDWSIGYYHCKECETYQGFSYQITEEVIPKGHNEQLEFMLAHAHGDGRIALFEKRMEEK
jgi:hypothetical protein